MNVLPAFARASDKPPLAKERLQLRRRSWFRGVRILIIGLSLGSLVPMVWGSASETSSQPPKQIAAKSVLQPGFVVGQRVILRQVQRKESAEGYAQVAARVQVDVLGREGDTYVLRWQVVKIEAPAGLSKTELDQFEKMTAGMKSPRLDILIQENVGIVGLKNWEQARDDTLALTERIALEESRKEGGNPDAERVKKITVAMRARMLNTREATEAMLLAQVHPYFDGSYHQIQIGEEKTEDFNVPWPFGNSSNQSILPGKRTRKLAMDPSNPDLLVLSVDMVPNPELLGKLALETVGEVAEDLGDRKKVPAPEAMHANVAFRWQFDKKRGWPTQVSSTKTMSSYGKRSKDELSWTLLTGPDAIAAEH